LGTAERSDGKQRIEQRRLVEQQLGEHVQQLGERLQRLELRQFELQQRRRRRVERRGPRRDFGRRLGRLRR
jgi:hypothetical protein